MPRKNDLQILWNQANVNSAGMIPASNDFIGFFPTVVTTPFRIAKAEGIIAVEQSDIGTSEVIYWFIADGSLTDAEIEECIEAKTLDIGDQVTSERSHRRVKFLTDADGLPIYMSKEQPVVSFSTKVNWTFREGKGWTIGAYNPHTSGWVGSDDYGLVVKYYGVWVE